MTIAKELATMGNVITFKFAFTKTPDKKITLKQYMCPQK